jgi:hypothetical protein
MKLRKIKKYMSLILTLSIFIQPLFLQFQLSAAQECYQRVLHENMAVKNCIQENLVHENPGYYDPNSYIDISPEKLDGLNLKELFRLIIEYAYETNSLHTLPQGLINCCKALENDETSLYAYDLAEALPIVIEAIADPAMHAKLLRAPRLDPDNAIVGPLLDCDLNKVVQLLNKLLKTINECCAELEFDFNVVFTSLSSLMASVTCDLTVVFSTVNTNFNGTFTVLTDIKNTLTTCCAESEFNFDGTFTALAQAACDLSSAFSVININFNDSFSVLSDIQNTLTTCCTNLEFNFDGTFTALENLVATVTCDFTVAFSILNTNFNGTFTVLTDIQNTLTTCCAELEFNFDGTFTALENLVATALCDFTGIFSVVSTNFEGTFTALNEIKNTLTACCAELELDFDGTFSVLATLITSVTCDFTSVFTISTNFEGTFTALNEIKNTLTTCCAALELDFDGTFSVLATLITSVTCDFTSIFTISTNFEGTFTALNEIKNTLTTCCDQLEQDLNGTFTALTNFIDSFCGLATLAALINTNFGGTFTTINDTKDTLTVCCSALEFNFDGTFTSLANVVATVTCDFTPIFTTINDIKDTLTVCCSELEFNFDGTFTSLANLMATASCDLSDIFTAMADIKDTLTSCCSNFNNTFTVLSDIRGTLTGCCAQLESDFNGTFTVISHLLLTLSCDFKPVFTALSSFKNSLTSCCTQLDFDFEGTFSVISHLALTATFDLSPVFTLLTDIKNTLTICCAAIEHDFDGTFTVLVDINNSLSVTSIDSNGTFSALNVLTAGICNPIVINQGSFGVGGLTPFVISNPGVYIFGENITFNPAIASQAIIIATSDVVLDLKCFTLQQGNLTAGVDGIRINSGHSDVTVRNGTVSNFTRAGITVQSNNLRPIIKNVTFLSCAVRGIEVLGIVGNPIQDAEITYCTIDSCSQGATGDFAFLIQQANTCIISFCDIRKCGVTGQALSALRADTCNELDVNSLNAFDNRGSTLFGIQLLAPTRSSFINCSVNANIATGALTGIDMSGAANQFNIFDNCQILTNTAGANFVGASLGANTNNNMFVNCNVSWNNGTSAVGVTLFGGGANNNQNSFQDSLISANNSIAGNSNGFIINGSDAGIILRSIISYNVSTTQAAGINFASPTGGNNWNIRNNLIIRNTGGSAANSSGILLIAGANNLFTLNGAFNNGGAGSLPGNQFNGVPAGSVVIPAAPATSNMGDGNLNLWNNAAIAL